MPHHGLYAYRSMSTSDETDGLRSSGAANGGGTSSPSRNPDTGELNGADFLDTANKRAYHQEAAG